MIYPQGNAIRVTAAPAFLQIGEPRYSKPPLDYIGHSDRSLEDASCLCLVSKIVIRRSNPTVEPPFEIALVPAGELRVLRRLKLEKDAVKVSRVMDVWAAEMRHGLQWGGVGAGSAVGALRRNSERIHTLGSPLKTIARPVSEIVLREVGHRQGTL